MAKVIGIDLGTTNSCMAVMEAGELVDMSSHSPGLRLAPNTARYQEPPTPTVTASLDRLRCAG